MAAGMLRPHSDESSVGVLGGAVFGRARRSRRAREPVDGPLIGVDQDVLFVAQARIDNRSGLVTALGDVAEHGCGDDADLLARAYLRWGASCVERVYGDWSFAAWHQRERRLVLARDHSGNTALFWHTDPRTGACWFASSRRALHAAGACRRLDEERLAAVLTAWPGANAFGTIDAGIERVPPAHIVSITGRSADRRRYWFPEQLAPLSGGSLDDYAAGLRDVLDEATGSRCEGGAVAVTLSGGLDSGSVAALAARTLGRAAVDLVGYTHVPTMESVQAVGPARFGNEGPLATATAEFVGLNEHHLLDSRAVSPVSGIEEMLRAHDEPGHAAANAFWISDLLRSASMRADVVLTGQGGNATISWAGRPPAETFAGRLRAGPRRALGYWLPVSAQRRRVRHVLRATDWRNTAIAPGFAGRLDLAGRIGDSLGRWPGLPTARTTPIGLRAAILQPGSSRLGEVWAANGAHFGIDVRDPTLDPRVVEYCWRIPDEVHRLRGGPDRAVIRAAMRGMLPDVVRTNTSRGRQSADLIARLRATGAQVDEALTRIGASNATEYVSIDSLTRAWAAAQRQDDPATTHRAGSILMRGMMAGLWLAHTYG